MFDACPRGSFLRDQVSPRESSPAVSMHPAKEVELPAAEAYGRRVHARKPFGHNPLVRRRLINRANVAVIGADVDAQSTESEQTVASNATGSSGTKATAKGVMSDAEVAEHERPSGGQPAGRRPSRRAAAIRKRKPADPDMPSMREGLTGPHKEKWMQAMIEEVQALSEHGTFVLVDLPPGVKAISGKWVFKIKGDPLVRSRGTKRGMLPGGLLRNME